MLVYTESGIRKVTTPEQAKKMILATATVLMCEVEELKFHDTIRTLAFHFKLDLNKIEKTIFDNKSELENGYPFVYKFIDS